MKQSRVDELYSRVEMIEQVMSTTFDMANKMRHIMTRLDGYTEAYDKYLADLDSVKAAKEINIVINKENEK